MLSLISLYAVRGQIVVAFVVVAFLVVAFIVVAFVVVVVYLLFDSVFPWQQQHRTLPSCACVLGGIMECRGRQPSSI